MTREELGITVEGEAFINAIIARGEIQDAIRTAYWMEERDIPQLRVRLAEAERLVETTREASRNSPEWVARYGGTP